MASHDDAVEPKDESGEDHGVAPGGARTDLDRDGHRVSCVEDGLFPTMLVEERDIVHDETADPFPPASACSHALGHDLGFGFVLGKGALRHRLLWEHHCLDPPFRGWRKRPRDVDAT